MNLAIGGSTWTHTHARFSDLSIKHVHIGGTTSTHTHTHTHMHTHTHTHSRLRYTRRKVKKSHHMFWYKLTIVISRHSTTCNIHVIALHDLSAGLYMFRSGGGGHACSHLLAGHNRPKLDDPSQQLHPSKPQQQTQNTQSH